MRTLQAVRTTDPGTAEVTHATQAALQALAARFECLVTSVERRGCASECRGVDVDAAMQQSWQALQTTTCRRLGTGREIS
jgi:hypothetical protein